MRTISRIYGKYIFIFTSYSLSIINGFHLVDHPGKNTPQGLYKCYTSLFYLSLKDAYSQGKTTAEI